MNRHTKINLIVRKILWKFVSWKFKIAYVIHSFCRFDYFLFVFIIRTTIIIYCRTKSKKFSSLFSNFRQLWNNVRNVRSNINIRITKFNNIAQFLFRNSIQNIQHFDSIRCWFRRKHEIRQMRQNCCYIYV